MILHSLRFRLICIYAAVVAFLVVGFGLGRYQLASYRSQQRFDAALKRDSKFFVERFKFDRIGFSLSTLGLSTGNGLAIQELEHYFVVTDPDGRVLRADLHNAYIRNMLDRGDLDEILKQQTGFGIAKAEDNSRYRFYSLALPPEIFSQPAIIHIGRSTELQREVIREYLLLYLYSVPLILAITIAFVWYLTGLSFKPFEEIARTAEKINYENLNTQIETTHEEEEVQRLVQSFNAMIRRLDASFNQMRKFNADAAHELRTPLAIIQGETEVALRSWSLPEEIRAVLASNLEELDRLTRIVNDLLILSEADAGRQMLMKQSVDAGKLLEDLVEQMRLLASDRSIKIHVHCLPDLWIVADELWIRRAVLNLLDNAIKYSKEMGIIEIHAWKEDSLVKLQVRDSGIGIHKEDLPFIFDRLYRADPARSRGTGGSGLGLALVKWIVEAHGGTIRVESEPDRRTLFEISLPSQ